MSINFSNLHHKTRVLIFSTQPEIAKFLIHTLNFHRKDYDFLCSDHQGVKENDFVILETANTEDATTFHPNICLITAEVSQESINNILPAITSGGALVYPEFLNVDLENASNYFRKLDFEKIEYVQTGESFTINSTMGKIPLNSKNSILADNLLGLQLIAQQFGIMEEEFYEAVMSYEPA